jgi:hypothetical protein
MKYVIYDADTGAIRHIATIPEEALEIQPWANEPHLAMASVPDQIWSMQVKDGQLVTKQIDPTQRTASCLEDLRRQRNRLLSMSDWTQIPDTRLDDSARQQWREYRDALRDLPSNSPDPCQVTWPVPPT